MCLLAVATIGKYGSTSYIGMTPKKMAANRKGIGPTTLKRACNTQLTHAPSSYAQNTLQRLANLRPGGERDGPNRPDFS